jgi:hypothetical protein
VNILKYILLAAILSASAAAHAAVVTVADITGTWTVTGGTNVNGEGTDSVRWGNPATSNGQSGYDFDAVLTPFIVTESPFDVGLFTHLNWPIASGTSISGADLTLSVAGDVDGLAFNIGGVYSFDHFETPNNGNPCAAGGSQPCPDLVTYLGASEVSDSVIVDGEEVFLSLEGFEDGFTFLTAEGAASSKMLRAAFTTEPIIDGNVPLPAAAWFLISGVAAFGIARRKK